MIERMVCTLVCKHRIYLDPKKQFLIRKHTWLRAPQGKPVAMDIHATVCSQALCFEILQDFYPYKQLGSI
jgi:hypothetical protein